MEEGLKSGRPAEVTNVATYKKVEDMILGNFCLQHFNIAQQINHG